MPRLLFVLAAPAFEGDGIVYATVARNILENGCVSLSDPAGAACAPHWGGNQLPGYPAFIAALWALSGGASAAPLIGQAVAYALAAAAVVHALLRAGAGPRTAVAAAALLAFSPTLVAWPRMLLTETLSLAVALWVLAAVLRSMADRQLRTVELGLAFAVGVFLRHDFVILSLPVAIAGIRLHGTAAALRRGIAIAAIVLIPVGAWTVRSIAAGLPPTPPIGLTTSGDPAPPGVMSWMRTWIVSQYELPHSVWPLVAAEYDRIKPRTDIYRSEAERARSEALLRELAGIGGVPVPVAIDAQFADLAAARRAAATLDVWIGLPLRRAASMWLSPFPSMGWPAETGSERQVLLEALGRRDWRAVADFVAGHPGQAAAKGVVAAWRGATLGILAFLLAGAVTGRRRLGDILWLALAFALVRTTLLAETVLVETRYLLPAMAWLEVAVLLELARRTATRAP